MLNMIDQGCLKAEGWMSAAFNPVLELNNWSFSNYLNSFAPINFSNICNYMKDQKIFIIK